MNKFETRFCIDIPLQQNQNVAKDKCGGGLALTSNTNIDHFSLQ